jgi:putative glutamine amidotransferase
MDFDTLVRTEGTALTARLVSVLGGDRAAAEDVRQEAFVRAWQSLPRGLDPDRQRAWLRRTAGTLAIDELRRRARRPAVSFEAAGDAVGAAVASEPDGALEALSRLSTAERFILLLRYQAGFSHLEVARLLDITEEAARKRVARARSAFVRAYRTTRGDATPLVVLLVRGESPDPYVRWLEDGGARVRLLSGVPSERELLLADGLVFTGSSRDLDSSLYGEEPRALRGEPDAQEDRADLGGVRTALSQGIPFVGVCRGHQLLNILTGGTLYQDVVLDGATGSSHDDGHHAVITRSDGTTRSLIGRSAQVSSTHHQAVHQLGRRLRVTARSSDGVIEMIERDDRPFAIGMQWHPEIDRRQAGDHVAQALVLAARARAA